MYYVLPLHVATKCTRENDVQVEEMFHQTLFGYVVTTIICIWIHMWNIYQFLRHLGAITVKLITLNVGIQHSSPHL